MNLGSPDSLKTGDVRRYLNEFLMDERVIDYPYVSRALLVKGIIVPFRAKKSAEAYSKIWTEEGSPLITLTKALKHSLQQKIENPVEIAMRYGNPNIKEVYSRLSANGVKTVTLLPLYPHYAMSSYETAVEQAKDIYNKGNYNFTIETIKPFYNNTLYINALSESIAPYLQKEYDHILFSYHGVPERHILKGDVTGNHCLKVNDCCNVPSAAHKYCYRHQCITTTRLVTETLEIPAEKFSHSFQSRLGRSEWLKPYTAEQLAILPSRGIKKLLIACPAFVSDCLETLEEIAQEGKKIFMEAGGESFTMIPCLNTHPAWVSTIVTWVDQLNKGDKQMLLQ